MTEKKFVKRLMISIITSLICIALIIILLDPFFHFHAQLDMFSYMLAEENERYQNYGIAKFYEYDAIITGTSMSENFKSSQFDELFDVNSIKTAFSGGTHKLIGEYLNNVLEDNTDVKLVLRSLDLDYIALDKDYIKPEYDNPQYMYDDNIFNDVNYIFNKDVLFTGNYKCVISPTIQNKETTSFDSYANWGKNQTFGMEEVLNTYTREEKSETPRNTDMEMVKENIEQNILEVAKNNQTVQFIYFIPPYSIAHYDELNQQSTVEEYIEEIKFVVSLMLEQENIQIYSFLDEYEIITNLDKYRDKTHYSEDINEYILDEIDKGNKEININNYIEHFEKITKFYLTYNYDEIF